MVEFRSGVRGMALNLETDNVGVVIFGNDRYPLSKLDKFNKEILLLELELLSMSQLDKRCWVEFLTHWEIQLMD